MVFYSFLYLFSVSILVFLLGRIFPRRLLRAQAFPFKSFGFEREGAIYLRVGIMKWKTKLPDASLLLARLFPRLMPKKRLEGEAKIAVLIKETCIAEMAHAAVAVLGFGCVWIWEGIGGWLLSLAFLLGNIPFILIQRFNRPRLIKAEAMLAKRRGILAGEKEQENEEGKKVK